MLQKGQIRFSDKSTSSTSAVRVWNPHPVTLVTAERRRTKASKASNAKMLTNTVVNITNYFYPIGNTPAVSLTQDLPYRQAAHILLLGCGDARNILYTIHADAGPGM